MRPRHRAPPIGRAFHVALQLAAALITVACGGPTDSISSSTLPVTTADPPSYAPPVTSTPRAGEVSGIALSGGYDQARVVALRVIEAVRDKDQDALERLLADPVLTMFPRLGQHSRPRADVIEATMEDARRGELDENVPLEQLFDPDQIEVIPLSRALDGRPIPLGLEGSDLQVILQLKPRGRQIFHQLLGWSIQGGLVVRPGVEPLVIAL